MLLRDGSCHCVSLYCSPGLGQPQAAGLRIGGLQQQQGIGGGESHIIEAHTIEAHYHIIISGGLQLGGLQQQQGLGIGGGESQTGLLVFEPYYHYRWSPVRTTAASYTTSAWRRRVEARLTGYSKHW